MREGSQAERTYRAGWHSLPSAGAHIVSRKMVKNVLRHSKLSRVANILCTSRERAQLGEKGGKAANQARPLTKREQPSSKAALDILSQPHQGCLCKDRKEKIW